MQAEDIKALLIAKLPDCEVRVAAEGSNFTITAIGDQFEGLNALKRQQLIYGVLAEHIADGTIHAVNMTTLTNAEAVQS